MRFSYTDSWNYEFTEFTEFRILDLIFWKYEFTEFAGRVVAGRVVAPPNPTHYWSWDFTIANMRSNEI